MKYWRMYTDDEGDRTCDLWYKFKMAFSGDFENNEFKHATVMRKLFAGDGIFMHHKKIGIVGYGVVKEDWDYTCYTGDDRLLYGQPHRKEYYEYRIDVDWDISCDCRANPLPIYGQLPYMGTYCEVKPNKGWYVHAVINELQKRA